MIFLRSLLHALWMLVTVVPWAIMMLTASLFLRGNPMYWLAVGWLSLAIRPKWKTRPGRLGMRQGWADFWRGRFGMMPQQ